MKKKNSPFNRVVTFLKVAICPCDNVSCVPCDNVSCFAFFDGFDYGSSTFLIIVICKSPIENQER